MSADHGAHHTAPDAKKGGGSKIWRAVFTVIAVGVGLIVLFTLGGSLFGMSIDAFSTAVQTVGGAVANAGHSIGLLSGSIRILSSGVSTFLLSLISVLILPVALVFIIGFLIKSMKKGGGDKH